MSQAERVLHRVFGYDSFRAGQQDIIEHVIGGGDALVLMPTGGGKSLCYQIPALLRRGVGVVVSPLIALMQDQVDALRALGVRAGYLALSALHERWPAVPRIALTATATEATHAEIASRLNLTGSRHFVAS